MIDMKYIGEKCREHRTKIGYSQADIAKELKYAPYSISRFERGLNNNAVMLLWYFLHGMTMVDLFPKGGKYNG